VGQSAPGRHDESTPAQPSGPRRPRVILLTGPSGAGKSRLAERLHTAYGWPVVRLDDFYRDGDDPALPMVTLGGHPIPDWDHPGSWNADAALAALTALVETGAAQTPTYDISTSRAIGSSTVSADPDQPILAEGIFAAEIAGALRAGGLLAGAYCVSQGRWRTFARRLVRDLRERRKPPLVLVRRGWELTRREPAIIQRAAMLGAPCVRPGEAERSITDRLIASTPA